MRIPPRASGMYIIKQSFPLVEKWRAVLLKAYDITATLYLKYLIKF